MDPLTIMAIGGALAGLMGQAKGTQTQVSVSQQQALDSINAISLNPIITVSSPQSTISPNGGGVTATGSPTSQSIPVTQSQIPSTGQTYSPTMTLPSASLPTMPPTSAPGILDSLDFGNPVLWVLGAAAVYLVFFGGK